MGSAIFFDNTDRNRFIDRIGTVLTEGKTTCYAFAFLSNHAHFLVRTGTSPIASLNIDPEEILLPGSIATGLPPGVSCAISWYGSSG
jgi:hypothetical protein